MLKDRPSRLLYLTFVRAVEAIGALLLLTLLVFALLDLSGGDLMSQWQASLPISDETAAQLRRIYGLDAPFWRRYLSWLGALLTGDLGDSLYFRAPVGELLWPRLARTAIVAALAFLISWSTALALGLAAARRPRSLIDRIVGICILFGSSAPRLVVALAALALLSRTAWFAGAASEAEMTTSLLRAVVPAIVLSVPLIALFLAQTRAAAGAMIDAEHVRAARAKGLSERSVLLRHVLRPALGPLLVTAGYGLGATFGGSVIVERVLGWPGIGQLTVTAVANRDLPLLLGIVLLTGAIVLTGNLIADLLLRLNDPRTREER